MSDDSPFLISTAERNYPVIVQNRNLYVYKDQLSAISPVFNRMIESDFVENKQGFIELKEKSVDDILELFGVLFSVSTFRKKVTWRNVEKMIRFADEYDVGQLREDVRIFLRMNLDFLEYHRDFCIHYANYAWKIGDCLDVVKHCVPFLCQTKFSDKDLPKSILAAVYAAKFNRASCKVHSVRKGYKGQCAQCSKKRCDRCERCSYCPSCMETDMLCNYHASNCQFYSKHSGVYDVSDRNFPCFCGYEFNENLLK